MATCHNVISCSRIDTVLCITPSPVILKWQEHHVDFYFSCYDALAMSSLQSHHVVAKLIRLKKNMLGECFRVIEDIWFLDGYLWIFEKYNFQSFYFLRHFNASQFNILYEKNKKKTIMILNYIVEDLELDSSLWIT